MLGLEPDWQTANVQTWLVGLLPSKITHTHNWLVSAECSFATVSSAPHSKADTDDEQNDKQCCRNTDTCQQRFINAGAAVIKRIDAAAAAGRDRCPTDIICRLTHIHDCHSELLHPHTRSDLEFELLPSPTQSY